MANKEISALTTAGLPLDGTEQFHIKQGANSRELNLNEVADFVGKGPLAQGLGHAKFTAPGDIFTTYNQGTPVQNAFDAATGHHVMEHLADDEISLALFSQAAGDFDHVFVLSGNLWSSANSPRFGITVGDGVDHTNFMLNDDGTRGFVKTFRNTNRFTFVSTPSTFNENGVDANFAWPTLTWWRVTRAGPNTSFQFSFNGLDWTEYFTGTDTENNMSAVTEVGVILFTNNVTESIVSRVRIVGYDAGPQPEAKTGGGTLPVAFKGFHVEKTGSAQSISASASAIVTMTQVNVDSESGWDGTDEYTVPASLDGKYGFFHAGADMGAAETFSLWIRKNAVTQGRANWDSAFDGVVTYGPVLLEEGDVWRFDVFANTALNVQNSPGTNFGMFVIESSEDAFDYVEDTSTSRTLTGADFKGNRTLEMNNAGAITVTVNTGLGPAGPLTIIQGGAGVISIAGTATIESAGSLTDSGGQHTAMTLIPTNDTDVYKLVGSLA